MFGNVAAGAEPDRIMADRSLSPGHARDTKIGKSFSHRRGRGELFQPAQQSPSSREERHDHANDPRRARRLLIASSALATAAYADSMTMWVRASGTNAAAHLIDLWNSTHRDKIELTTIPDNQMVTKLATGVQAGEVPDLVSFDLIYMPDFMKAGFLTDLTADLKANPNLRFRRPGLQGHRHL